jgi:hypothetical protein
MTSLFGGNNSIMAPNPMMKRLLVLKKKPTPSELCSINEKVLYQIISEIILGFLTFIFHFCIMLISVSITAV